MIVTGATGGVGSIGVQCLAARGYEVTALTGKRSEHEYLRVAGRDDVVSRRHAADGDAAAREGDVGGRRRSGRRRDPRVADADDDVRRLHRELGADRRDRAAARP